jgi:hypothetical protein
MQSKRCNYCQRDFPIDMMRKGRNQCKECRKLWEKEYQKGYRARNDNRAYQREYHKTYQRKQSTEYFRKYKRQNKGRVHVIQQNYEARKNALPDTLTYAQWQNVLNYFNGCCAVCGRQLNDMFGEFTVAMDHWIPLSYKGHDNPGSVSANIIPLCHGVSGCNNSKHDIMPDEWLAQRFGKRKAKKIVARVQQYFDSLE